MNLEVAERLIANLEQQPIKHNQNAWLRDHGDIFIISDEDRWSCATSGCAAGFIFLEEAPPGTVFNERLGTVFTSMEIASTAQKIYYDAQRYDAERESQSLGTPIDYWAADVLGIEFGDESDFLFYQWGDTRETIARIRHLMSGKSIYDYV